MRMRDLPDPAVYSRRPLVEILTTATGFADGLAAAAGDVGELFDLRAFIARLDSAVERRLIALEAADQPTTSRVLPYPPDPAEVAADIARALAFCFGAVGW